MTKTYTTNIVCEQDVSTMFALLSFKGFTPVMSNSTCGWNGEPAICWLFKIGENAVTLLLQEATENTKSTLQLIIDSADNIDDSVTMNISDRLIDHTREAVDKLYDAIELAARSDILQMFRNEGK